MRWEVRNFGVDVILIEPGLIKTEFGETAAHSVNEALPTDGPYAEFNQMVASTTAGPMRPVPQPTRGRSQSGSRRRSRASGQERAIRSRSARGVARRAEGPTRARLGRADADSVQAAGRLGSSRSGNQAAGRPSGTPRCTRARAPSVVGRRAALEIGRQVLVSEEQPYARRDLEVGRVQLVAADHTLGDQRVHLVDLLGIAARSARTASSVELL